MTLSNGYSYNGKFIKDLGRNYIGKRNWRKIRREFRKWKEKWVKTNKKSFSFGVLTWKNYKYK